jgi:hypothetical protein
MHCIIRAINSKQNAIDGVFVAAIEAARLLAIEVGN